MASYSIITQSQLDKIRQKVQPHTEDSVTEERKRLKQLSEERAGKWPNTLQAQRARKERAKQERLAAEEAERVEIDKREAALRAEQRQIQIERANKILFDETDRVKAFHSKMIMGDIIQENEKLITFKKQISVLKQAQEQAFVEQQRQALEAAEEAELAKFAEMKRRALDQRDVQLDQLEQLKTKILAERAQDKAEGKVLKQKALEEAEEQKLKELARIEKMKQLNMETKLANDTLNAFKAKEVERQKEQERAIEVYAKKKAELQAERSRREAEKKAAKEAERKRLADAMEQNYLAWHTKEEARVAKEVALAEEKKAADEAARLRRLQEQMAAIDASRKQQLAMKQEIRAREKADDLDFVGEWTQRTKELKQEEEAEAAERRERARQLQAFQLHQAELRARKKVTAKMAELEEAAQLQLSLKEQEDMFREYTQICLEEYRRQGKPVAPMELHLRKKPTVESMS